jgi:MoaA/NifB/PqqE/SkfB family radical SAM enzyme
MFGITNACNLACAFCSRDTARPSAWTVETAAAALRGLHDAGTLEIAYGGGEPFASGSVET